MQLSVWIIIAGGFFEAFFGGGLLSLYSQVAAVMVDVTRLSYVNQIKSDNTISEEKTNQEIWLWFTVFESIALLCSSMGSPIGGTIIYRYGFNAAVITCVSLFVPSLILICILPEPRKAFNKATNVSEMMDGDSTNGAGVDGVEDDIRTIEIQQNWKKRFIIKLQALRHLDPILIMVIVIVILASISSMVDLQYIVIYLMGSPFLWNPQQVGIYIGVSDFISSSLGIAYTIIVVRLRQRRNSKKKRPVSEETLSSQTEIINDAPALSFIRHMKLLVFTLAGSLAMMTVNKKANIIVYAAAIPRLVKSLVAPIARSMFSICTPPGNQGMIQSFGGFIARIGILISLTALPALYAATVTVFPQAVFITVGAVMVITIIFDLCILPLLKSKRIQHSPNAKA
ncbi:unnamed protein product [Heterobilharzia americana]|nr:unnamed protein product [Heterobilharzia americana]